MLDDTKIRNHNLVGQVRDFSGIRYGSIYPTDLDGLIEYHNKCFVFIETKYGDAELPGGQRLALERLCDDMQRTKPALLIICSHNSSGDIDMANTIAREFRYRFEWTTCNTRITTKDLITRFLVFVDNPGKKLTTPP